MGVFALRSWREIRSLVRFGVGKREVLRIVGVADRDGIVLWI